MRPDGSRDPLRSSKHGQVRDSRKCAYRLRRQPGAKEFVACLGRELGAARDAPAKGTLEGVFPADQYRAANRPILRRRLLDVGIRSESPTIARFWAHWRARPLVPYTQGDGWRRAERSRKNKMVVPV